MESKGRELLPKIQEVIENLRETTRPPPTSSADKKTRPKEGEDSGPSKVGVEFDLSLPIDLPGLVSSSYPSVPPGRRPVGTSVGDGRGSRPKSKQVESSSAKEAKSGGSRVKTSQAGEGKTDPSAAAREGKGKEEGKEEVAVDEAGTRDKEKRPSKVKRVREEVKEKAAVQEKPKEKSIHQERVMAVRATAEEESGGEERSRESSSASGKEPASHSENRKQEQELPTRRRSARIASLTEDTKKEVSDAESETTVREYRPKRRGSGDAQAQQHTRPSKKRSAKARRSARRRGRMSSSEESEEEMEQEGAASKETDVERNGSGTRKRQHDTADRDTASTQPKRPRRCSKSGSPTSLPPGQEPASNKRKSRAPQRLPLSRASKSPTMKSPVKSPSPVVTRFNRQVKPNRKYYDPSEEQEESEGGKESEDSGDQASDDDVYLEQ